MVININNARNKYNEEKAHTCLAFTPLGHPTTGKTGSLGPNGVGACRGQILNYYLIACGKDQQLIEESLLTSLFNWVG